MIPDAPVTSKTDSLIPPGYLFSQHSLNTYLRCPRRFLLKYVEQQPWPMPEEEDPLRYQQHLARGRTFHQWLAREHLGLPMAPIVAACGDPELQAWWEAARHFDRDALPAGMREAELPIVVPLGQYRLYARYDFLALDPGEEAVVVDWKTLAFLPSARVLASRVQTRVYLYTLVTVGHVLSGGMPLYPASARMVYWFANYPEETLAVPYSEQAYRRDGRELLQLANTIASQPRDSFQRTDDIRQCAHCNYRSLCQREESRPSTPESGWLDEDIDLALELEDVPELEY